MTNWKYPSKNNPELRLEKGCLYLKKGRKVVTLGFMGDNYAESVVYNPRTGEVTTLVVNPRKRRTEKKENPNKEPVKDIAINIRKALSAQGLLDKDKGLISMIQQILLIEGLD